MSAVSAALAALVSGRDLDAQQMERAVGAILDGEASDAQIGAFLTALTTKGETLDEVVAAVRAMRARSVRVPSPSPPGPLLDTCGTGGDGLGTFNVSTATAFVAAAAGVRVAKHGNRAASGKVGAADVLETLGVNIELTPERAREALETVGFAFLFAPAFHPALGRLAGPRRELGFRTLFNLLGPLCNPAGADHQLLGVYDARRAETLAAALVRLGTKRALVVHGHGGADELTPTGPAEVVEVADGGTRRYRLDPQSVGIDRCADGDLEGGDAERNAAIMLDALRPREWGPLNDAVALNVGAALYTVGRAASVGEGVAIGRDLVRTGAGLAKLEEFARFSHKCSE